MPDLGGETNQQLAEKVRAGLGIPKRYDPKVQDATPEARAILAITDLLLDIAEAAKETPHFNDEDEVCRGHLCSLCAALARLESSNA